MITAERKPFGEIADMVQDAKKLLILGCGSCVTVCMAGGEKEVAMLASAMRLANRKAGRKADIREATIERQCDREWFDKVAEDIEWADAVLSMACGVGAQFCGEAFEGKRVVPALNTKFYGATERQGVWVERCAGCGKCVLADFGGVCPIARCSKSLLNGPCGGSQDGKCEVDPDRLDCGWQLIHDRMKLLGLLDRLEAVQPLKDWSAGGDGGPGRIVREDATL
ncbi:MAG: methylenetetrahydrofolate reductase C-terminal domain-containing protein [Verrucomicrobiota bacterium]|nr:methylenetetrahydrofolate reductase C-terminal domain-containing protein [Verrucomicrobiota bacterium]